MKLQQFKNRFGWPTALGILLFVGVLELTGVMLSSDRAIRDLMIRLTARARQNNYVVLVYASPAMLESDSGQLESLIECIDRCDPKQIGIVFDELDVEFEDRKINENNDESVANWKSESRRGLPHRFAGRSNMVVGLSLDELSLDELSATSVDDDETPSVQSAGNFRLLFGFTDLHLSGQSVYRRATAAFQTPAGKIDSFEKQLARRVLPSDEGLPEGEFGIRFESGVNSLPHIKASDLLSGNVVPELFANKVVLIGSAKNSTYGLVTPTTCGNERMSRLELRGHILETMLRGQAVYRVSQVTSLLIIILLTIVISQIWRQISGHILPYVYVCSVAGIILASTGCYYWLGLNIPVTAMILTVTLSAGMALYQRFQVLGEVTGFWRLMLNVSDSGQDEATLEQSWQSVSDAVFQMFNPTRMALLELAPGGTYLQVVRTIHCEPAQIFEQRRDVNREPFQSPVAQGQPVRIDSRSFFAPEQDSSEAEFMVPLIAGGKVIGFMALAMENTVLDKWLDFDNFLERFAGEMSILVAGSRAAIVEKLERRKTVCRLASFPEQKDFDTIERQKSAQAELIEQTEFAFESSESALAVCDIFGRIIKRNSNLVRLIRNVYPTASSFTFIEMMVAISGRSPDECRRIFRQVIIENRSQEILVAADENRPHPGLMFVKPVRLPGGDSGSRGAIVEFIDGQNFDRISTWQDRLTESLYESANESLAELQQKAERLGAAEREEKSLDSLVGCFGDTVSTVLSVLEDFQTLNHCRISEEPDECLLLDPNFVWESALEKIQPRLDARHVRVPKQFSNEQCAVVANPFLLERMFSTILEFLLQNAFDQTEILIGADKAGDRVCLRFRNCGGGTPIQGLRRSLNGTPSAETESGADDSLKLLTEEQADRFNEIREWLEIWDGSLVISNPDEGGLLIELVLAAKRKIAVGMTRTRTRLSQGK